MTAPEQMLKPCPFCGNDGTGPVEDALHISHHELSWRDSCDAYSVQCDKCTATMGYSDSEEEAVEAWNTRPAPAELVEALKEIADPISFMQRRAEAKGHRIDGMMANHLARDPEYLKEIARTALRNTGAAL